jgi:hypothetical protein
MTAVTREQIAVALWNLVSGAATFAGRSRRWQHWDKVKDSKKPFVTMLKTGEKRTPQGEGLATLTLNYHVFVYTSAGLDPNNVPDTPMNALLDAIDQAMKPSGGDIMSNVQTLGLPNVSHCYASGPVFVDNGDVDGKGVAAIPVEIQVGWY